jgi:hypothetical protein
MVRGKLPDPRQTSVSGFENLSNPAELIVKIERKKSLDSLEHKEKTPYPLSRTPKYL